MTDRRALYNPISPYGDQTYDPLHPYSGQNQERMARPFRFSQDPSNADGIRVRRSIMVVRISFFPGLAVGRGAERQRVRASQPSARWTKRF